MPLSLPRRLPRAGLIALLSVSQIIGWGTTFDMPGVLGRRIAADLGLSSEMIYLGLTVMMLVLAFAGPKTGRLLARHGAARILSVGSCLMASGLLLLSLAQGPVLYLGAWLVIGLGGAFGLSVPAYTAVVEREGAGAKRSIGILMIFTGLSAAVCWPLLSLLDQQVGWRLALVIAAGTQLLVCLPLHALALTKPEARSAEETSAADAEPLALTPRQSGLAFLLIAIATSIFSLITFGLSPSLIHILEVSGASPALALQLGSLRSVLGISARAVDVLIGKRSSPVLTGLVGSAFLVLAMVALLLADGQTSMLWLFIALYGFGSGISALSRALLPLSFFSASSFAQQSARLSLPQNLANAAAPVLFTALLDRQGATTALVALALLAITALTCIVALALMARRARVAT